MSYLYFSFSVALHFKSSITGLLSTFHSKFKVLIMCSSIIQNYLVFKEILNFAKYNLLLMQLLFLKSNFQFLWFIQVLQSYDWNFNYNTINLDVKCLWSDRILLKSLLDIQISKKRLLSEITKLLWSYLQ